jgi:hypothetical protein
MVKLTGIGAFEACWQSLKAMYSIDPGESQLLMQSMSRLVDNYASQSEIASELSLPLQKLFNLLVQSYLEGYWIEDETSSLEDCAESNASESVPYYTHRSSRHPSSSGPACYLSPAMAAADQHRQRQRIEPTVNSEADTYFVI